jgi:DNA-binding transcriptional ArsR family regulator
VPNYIKAFTNSRQQTDSTEPSGLISNFLLIDKAEPGDDATPSIPQAGESKREIRPKKVQPSSEPLSSAEIDSELRGKTLRAYLYMMKLSKPVGVRELQRSLDLSSPSVAYHHLEKLERLGLVEKDQYGAYVLVKNIDVGVLQAFARIGTLIVPRFVFYAMFFTTLLVGYLLIYLGNSNVYVLIFGIAAAAFAWYETIRTWRRRPF